jgi:hypothetical protein
VAPYHLRLDWLRWFLARRRFHVPDWFLRLVLKLLANDRATLRLLRHSPFAERTPAFVRARLYRYRFTTRAERRATGCGWSCELAGEYLPPLAADD